MGHGNVHRNTRAGRNDRFNRDNKYNEGQSYQPRQEEPAIQSVSVDIEEKTFHVEDRKNERGAFIKLVETNRNHSRKNHLVVPREGAKELAEAILAVLRNENKPVTA